MDENLRYADLYELIHQLKLADRNSQKATEKYFLTHCPTRARATTLYAKRVIAAEWFGKCELAFEKYINAKIVNGKFSLSYRPTEGNNE